VGKNNCFLSVSWLKFSDSDLVIHLRLIGRRTAQSRFIRSNSFFLVPRSTRRVGWVLGWFASGETAESRFLESLTSKFAYL
jgi:hypothetical protein